MQRRPREPQPAESPAPDPVGALELTSFEALMSEIERITASLERGDLPLQESLTAFERASLLTRHAQRLLEQAEVRLTRLVEGAPGEVVEVPFSLDQTGQSGQSAQAGRKDEG